MRDRDELKARSLALIARLADGSRDDAARDALLGDILAFQTRAIPNYGRIVRAGALRARGSIALSQWPAVPTDVLRHARLAVHPPEQDVRVFRTSGTTDSERGAHPFRDLTLYDHAARAGATYALFPDLKKSHLIVLAPRESDALDSSLSYMLARFAEWFESGESTWVMRGGALNSESLRQALIDARGPTTLLGTSFAFVHAEDALGNLRVALPEGSRIMQTGGFKGRSREITPDAMRAMLEARYGVPHDRIVAEYGMTELSSQMYETTLRAPDEPRRLWVPGWVRASPVDPESLLPVEGGKVGVLRIDDAANVDTVCAIQTSDLARRVRDGIEVLGRATGSTPRGCSLALDAVLGGRK